jgi:hypothetical protein
MLNYDLIYLFKLRLEIAKYQQTLSNNCDRQPRTHAGANNVLKIETLQCFYIDQWLR